MTHLAASIVLVTALAASAPAQSGPARPDSKAAVPLVRAPEKPVWPDEGPATWAPRPTVAAITANDLRTRLYQFADDSMRGRRIGEPGNFAGTTYIAAEFKRLGLKPAGDSGTYFQIMPYGPMGFDPATLSLKVAGAALSLRSEWLPIAPSSPNQFVGNSDLADVPTVFAGRWGDTTVVLDPAVYANKVLVFVSQPAVAGLGGPAGREPQRCDALPNRFGAAAAIIADAAQPPRGGGRGAGRDPRPMAVGAKGVLVITLDLASPVALANALNPRSGMRPDVTGIPAAAIHSSVAMRLFGRPLAQVAPGAVGQPISASWTHQWMPSRSQARNVIAVLPGSDPGLAAEYVLVGAHNDHVGVDLDPEDHDSLRAVNTVTRPQGANDPVCRPTAEQQHRIDSMIARARSIRPPRLDSIMNGADDDGSGTVVLLEIAEQFVKEKPARSIIFVSHQGEESGLLGSRWFVDHPTVALGQIVAAHNMDMLGKGRADQVKFGGPASVQTLGSRRLSREFGDIIDSVNATRAEVMAIDKSWDVTANPMNRFCRSDQVNYVRKDVPVTYFSTGYAQDYHQATDEARYVDYDHAARIGRFVHDVMMAVAMRKDRPAIAGPDPSYPSCR